MTPRLRRFALTLTALLGAASALAPAAANASMGDKDVARMVSFGGACAKCELSGRKLNGNRIGSLIAALPLVTVLTLLWLYFEKQPAERITSHAWYTFWYVLPTLPMFALFPLMHRHGGFWGALAGSVVLTVVCFALLAWVMRRFGVELL